MLENLDKFKPPAECEVEVFASQLEGNDKSLFEDYLADQQNWTPVDLSIALYGLGLTLISSSITSHRDKVCRCYWNIDSALTKNIKEATLDNKNNSTSTKKASSDRYKHQRIVTEPVAHYGIPISTLIEQGFIFIGEKLVSLAKLYPGEAKIYDDGQIVYSGTHYSSISSAAIACKRTYDPSLVSENGWTFWGVERKGLLISLKDIRDNFISGEKSSLPNNSRIESLDKKEIISISDLIQAQLIVEGDILYSATRKYTLKITKKGIKSPNGESFKTLKDAAKFAEYGDTNSDKYINGWRYWHYEKNGKLFPLSKLRDTLISI
jgi:hypothetical protein